MSAIDVKTMRQATRCFWFGVAGLLPVAGAGLAWQALQLSTEIEGGRPQRQIGFSVSLWLAAAAATPFLMASVNWPPVAVISLAVAVIDAANDYCGRRAWNPAARWAWAGAMLARTGLALSAILALALLTMVFDFVLFGT